MGENLSRIGSRRWSNLILSFLSEETKLSRSVQISQEKEVDCDVVKNELM